MTAAQRSAHGDDDCAERTLVAPFACPLVFRRGSRIRDGLARRVPVKPSSAGSRVREPRTVIATVAAAATATPFISDSRSTSSPIMPITTVVPATSTERPAVRIACTAASSAVLARGGDPPEPPAALRAPLRYIAESPATRRA